MSCIPGLSHRKGLALEVIKSVSLIDSKNLDMKVLNCPENIHTPLKVILSSILQENDILKLDIDPKSHYAWTGGAQKILDKGRVSKYNKKFSNLRSKK